MKIAKHNTSLILIVTGYLLLSTNLFSQTQMHQQRPPQIPDSTRIVDMVNHLSKSLSLSVDQKKVLLDMHQTHFKKVSELLKIHENTRANHRQKMDTVREEFKNSIKAQLTKEQQSAFDKLPKQQGKQPNQIERQKGNRSSKGKGQRRN